MDANWSDDELELRRVFGRARRHIPTVITYAIIGLVAGFIYLMVAAPKYTAQTTLLLETRTSEIGNAQTLFLDLDTHANLIRSDAIVAKVVRRLNLSESFMPDNGPLLSALNFARSQLSRPVFGDIPDANGLPTDAAMVFASVPNVRSKLDIVRVGETRLLNLTFTSQNPEQAAEVANAFAEVYVDHLQRVALRMQEGRGISSTGEDGVLSIEIEGGLPLLEIDNPGLFDDLRIVSWASVPTSHSWPNVNVILAVFTILGFAIGLVASVRREWKNAG